MYIQLTTRCNMRCAHCCFAATEQGEDMSFNTFVQALELAKRHNLSICLGGGEPTVHPQIKDFVKLAYRYLGSNRIGVITNGKIIDRALFLAGMAKQGFIHAELSRDEFHERISDEVVNAFINVNLQGRTIRDVTESYQGRCKPAIIMGREMQRRGITQRPSNARCPASGPFIKPDGTIRQCGCDDAAVVGRVGTFYKPICVGCCHRSQQFRVVAIMRRLQPAG